MRAGRELIGRGTWQSTRGPIKWLEAGGHNKLAGSKTNTPPTSGFYKQRTKAQRSNEGGCCIDTWSKDSSCSSWYSLFDRFSNRNKCMCTSLLFSFCVSETWLLLIRKHTFEAQMQSACRRKIPPAVSTWTWTCLISQEPAVFSYCVKWGTNGWEKFITRWADFQICSNIGVIQFI